MLPYLTACAGWVTEGSTVPKGEGRKLLDDLVSRDEHADFVRSLEDDPDLATT